MSRSPLLTILLLLVCIETLVVARDGPSGLYWRDLSVSTQNPDSLSSVTILQPFTASIANGHACAIIGPSGSGKSTLLAALGGTSSLHVGGSIWILDSDTGDASIVSNQQGHVAHLQQHDAFFSMLTVFETMQFAAYLQFPEMAQRQRRVLIDKNLDSLGLGKVKSRLIGDRTIASATQNGLSGGERRRLSVGLELLSTPKVFLADESTTGLDSSQASKIVKLIVDLAQVRQIPALLTLHQPRASIWKMLDSFILLAPGGKVCYAGKRKEAQVYFEKIGYYVPPDTNPAEFYIDLVSIDTEDPIQGAIDEKRIDYLANFFRETQAETTMEVPTIITSSEAVATTTILKPGRLGALVLRSWRQNYRNSRYNVIRLLASVGSSALLSQIFKSVRKGVPADARSIADRAALLSFGVVNMSMMALAKTIHLFSKEKAVVDREQGRMQYSSLEYLASKIIAELPLDTFFAAAFTTVLKSVTGLRMSWANLTTTFAAMTAAGASLGFAIGGCCSGDGDTAMAVGLPLMVTFMVVGIINPSGVDKSLPPSLLVQLLKMASPIRWAIEGLLVAEFKGLDLRQKNQLPWERVKDLPKVGAFVLVQNGDQILDTLGLEKSTYNGALRHLAILSCCNLFISWAGLSWNQRSRGRSDFDEEKGEIPKVTESADDTGTDTGTDRIAAAAAAAQVTRQNDGGVKPPIPVNQVPPPI